MLYIFSAQNLALLQNDFCVCAGGDLSALGIWKIQSQAKGKGGVQT